MGNFYDEWLGLWDAEESARKQARTIIHEEELQWVKTKQDYRAALLSSPENGFFTAGTTMLAEIPKGWNTGKHSHGEEAIFIVQGTGFTVVDGKRYDWEKDSCLFMPYGSVHQHFNTGDSDVRYFSAMGLPLEKFAGLAKFTQFEEACETPMGALDKFTRAESDVDPEVGRIVLRRKDAPDILAKDRSAYLKKHDDGFHPKEMVNAPQEEHHANIVRLMNAPENGFKAREVEITDIMCDNPGGTSHKHAHMEAIIYVLDGQGFSIIDRQKIEWKKGSLLEVQGPQTVHQHFNSGKTVSQLLRIHFGLRATYFQQVAKRVFPYTYFKPEHPKL